MEKKNSPVSLRNAVTITFIGKYSNIFIQLLYGAILARILSPEDFGIVAVVTVFTSFFTLIANIGVGPAIIQNRDLDATDINHIFSLTLYVGVVVSILFSFFSIPLSIFYENSVYIPIGLSLSISLFFNTINIVPNALLLKNHKFKLVNIRLVIVSLTTAIPTIFLALLGFKYYALVIHSILVSLIIFIWNVITTRPTVVLKIDNFRIQKIREFSSYQFLFGLVNYFSRNLDNLLIGKFLGSAALGYYDKSYKLMLYPVQNLTHVITPVLHPILSVHQEDSDFIYQKYIGVVKILSLLGVFITAFSFYASEEIILILYGSQWKDSITSFRFLSLSIWAQMITSSTGSIFQSLGKTKYLFITGTISAVIIVSSIIIGILFKDLNTVALCVAIAYNINMFTSFFILIRKGFRKSFNFFAKNFVPDLLILLSQMLGMYLLSSVFRQPLLINVVLKLIICSTLYVVSLLIFRQLKYLKKYLK